MGLLKKFFGGREGRDTQPQSSQFHESETTAQRANSANADRRELVQVVLRDTMRRHGIPSDWIDCRILSVVTRQRRSGMHVQFIVGKGQARMLSFVHEFQRTFWHSLEQFEPKAREWLFSVAWQFDGPGEVATARAMAPEWTELDTQPAGDTQPPEVSDELETDLRALYAIRDAALSEPAPLAKPPAAPSRPGNLGGS